MKCSKKWRNWLIFSPLDLNKIGSKVRQGAYVTLEECQSDLMLMFDNACKYNEPDSQIYKDALTLQNVVVRTAKTLAEEDLDESAVPNVTEAVQEILSHIFSQMYNQQVISNFFIYVLHFDDFFFFLYRIRMNVVIRILWRSYRNITKSTGKKFVLWIWIWLSGDWIVDCTRDWMTFKEIFSVCLIAQGTYQGRIRKFLRTQ